ncbi:thiamin pyrophosphokinase 1 [Musca vetustissima]|uniref:thiamin pyrophosphokinase 1 n=1 Tax=Musca vetustissima TaxID=27455 RepID=UPI002AB6801F|nr:thiamin pyrophosphokinase 1 [Musca vetustissima]
MLNNCSGTNGGNTEEQPNDSVCHWDPTAILSEPYLAGGLGHGCLVLNRNIKSPSHVVKALWNNASIRCCVDGGTNKWLNFLRTELKNDDDDIQLPDLITGDFDSICRETEEYFTSRGVRRIHTPDQNNTDFTKAVDVLKPMLREKQLRDIIVLHDTSGRFDQIMSNINTLYTRNDEFCNIYLFGSCSLTWLLRPGKHSIVIPTHLVEEQRWCSLLPIGQEATNVTTKGLKWNLTHGKTFFGGLVSTSNTYASTLIEIETNSSLIWSMGVFYFGDD